MAITTVTAQNMLLGRWRIYSGKFKWTEKFWLSSQTSAISQALADLAAGMWWRAAWLASDAYVGLASISSPGKPRDRRPVTDAQLGTPPLDWAELPLLMPFTDAADDLESNDPYVGPELVFSNASGKSATRFITGVPDGDVIGLKWVGGSTGGTLLAPQAFPVVAGADVAAGNAATATLAARSQYLRWLKTKTIWASRTSGTGPVQPADTFGTEAWFNVALGRIGKHNRGGLDSRGRRPSGS